MQAKAARRLPVVLTPSEVRALLNEMSGVMGLIGALLYGTGMRLLEGLRLRVKDVEFQRREIVIREGKGNKDRVTVLPENLIEPLRRQLDRARRLHEGDLAQGFGEVHLPHALAEKYRNAARAWGWQFIFPSPVRSIDPRSNKTRRHHQALHAARAAPLVRHPHAASRLRHPHRAGTAWSRRCFNDDDLHARAEQGRPRRVESAGRAVMRPSLFARALRTSAFAPVSGKQTSARAFVASGMTQTVSA